MKANDRKETNEGTVRKSWTRPQLTYVGNVGEVLQGGGGKLSPSVADKGDMGKPSGQG